ncbi:MAG: LLM class flavin-dependent oxidoreductase [Gaiellaceae bacterium]
MIDASIKVFSTCVQSADVDGQEYAQRVANVSRWSERVGCKGMLIYADNRLVDPWLVAHIVLQSTTGLAPLVAVQPVYMHPYTVANLVASYGEIYQRRIYLNMVAGGFRNDLLALDDQTPHDSRYDRLIEYTTIVTELLERSGAGSALTFEGDFYRVENLRLSPALSPDLAPGVFVSGSSDAGLAAARALGATAIQYPTPADEFADVALDADLGYGIRVGIVAREESDDAWRVAEERFPADRKGELTRQLADRTSDSEWHHQLAAQAAGASRERDTYWLVPFMHYKTMCPYLVGSYGEVGSYLSAYRTKGYGTFILDIPPSEEELEHAARAFAIGADMARAGTRA